jgi:adenylosuccinate lyase
VAHELAIGIHVDEASIAAKMDAHLPFLAVERILAELVKAGGDRQEGHEKLRLYAMECYEDRSKDFHEVLFEDPLFKPLKRSLKKLVDAKNLTGMAKVQVDNYLEATVRPLLQRFSNVPAVADTLSV